MSQSETGTRNRGAPGEAFLHPCAIRLLERAARGARRARSRRDRARRNPRRARRQLHSQLRTGTVMRSAWPARGCAPCSAASSRARRSTPCGARRTVPRRATSSTSPPMRSPASSPASTGVTGEGVSVDLELLLLPLRHRGSSRARQIGVLAPLVVPFWLGATPVTDAQPQIAPAYRSGARERSRLWSRHRRQWAAASRPSGLRRRARVTFRDAIQGLCAEANEPLTMRE